MPPDISHVTSIDNLPGQNLATLPERMYLHVASTYARHTPPSNNPGIQFMHDPPIHPSIHQPNPTESESKIPIQPDKSVQITHSNPHRGTNLRIARK
ncbi:uncharacterized protein BO80DRAFT_421749 [Aspergillus ibericus CBS 121593]|uniref:Uncharacterized protein n=1 Tax=Aspergillus ibericus CBS 121593 TaxID=1448316 RepID=A0A395HBN4_9EURO|nr:hypothetical protein BO80DRAFT_421749 [Aspergillus ibericus CBS 121593]RAL05110.1 hypothetical protein BO80DRAFT_421749 [Aspergillus ibericus CBS 121593]